MWARQTSAMRWEREMRQFTFAIRRSYPERSERGASYTRLYLPGYLSVAFPDLWEVSCNLASCYKIHLTSSIGFILLYATFLEGGTMQPLTTRGRMQDSGKKTAQASCPDPCHSLVFYFYGHHTFHKRFPNFQSPTLSNDCVLEVEFREVQIREEVKICEVEIREVKIR